MSFKNPSQLWSAVASVCVALSIAGCPETPQMMDVLTVDVPNSDRPNADVPNFDVPNVDVPNPPADVVLPCPSGQERCGVTCVNRQVDNRNCGACGNVCPAGSTCSMGTCDATCRMGLSDCGGSCRDLQNDPSACGMCGNNCGEGNLNGTAFCRVGMCSVTCNAGFGDCDGDPANGCEVPLNSPEHCGACGAACLVPNANPVCDIGGCGVGSCRVGFADCNRNGRDGCEANVNTDRANCGACGRPCDNGQVCSAGVCVASCRVGLTNCSGSCRDLQNDPNSCGMCGTMCPSGPNSIPVCAAGACRLICAQGFGDCDGNAANGCETPLNTATNCRACGLACNIVNGLGSCGGGVCALNSCNAGFANCNMNAADGCEVDTRSSVANCGACGAACNLANASATCGAGACAINACNAGFGNCDMMAANGCETNLNTTATSCGACGRACAAGQTCRAGVCQAGGGCAGNPQWMPVSCTTNSWVWSMDRARAQTVAAANTARVLATGCAHGAPQPALGQGLCSLDGTGFVSTRTFVMAGCNASWLHLVAGAPFDCGGHDGDTYRLLVTGANDCYAY